MPDLRAVLVVDYQNVHLTAHELFAVSRHLPRHESLVDPLYFGNQLIAARNHAQRPGMDHAVLARLLVYRGQPSADHDPKPYARNQAQKAQWERDRRVSVIHRPLKYRYERDATGRPRLDAAGKRIVESKGEKGYIAWLRGPTSDMIKWLRSLICQSRHRARRQRARGRRALLADAEATGASVSLDPPLKWVAGGGS